MHRTHQRRRCPRAAWRSPRAAREPLSWPVDQPQRSRQVRYARPLELSCSSRTGLVVTAFLSIHGFSTMSIHGFSTVEHHFYYWFMSATSRARARSCKVEKNQKLFFLLSKLGGELQEAKAWKSLIPSTESACGRPRSAHRMRNRHR